jgi:hypothetical protein
VRARVLDRAERAGVTVGWRHTFIDTPAHHPAVPVRPADVDTAGQCDFCSADAPSWEIPAQPFVYEGAPDAGWDAGSDGDWAACDACPS